MRAVVLAACVVIRLSSPLVAPSARSPPSARVGRSVACPARLPADDDDDDDETWVRLAKSKEDAVDVFIDWAREEAQFATCVRVVALRRGRFGGDIGPERWPLALRKRLAPGLARRGAARSARRAVWAKNYTSESLRVTWTSLQTAYDEQKRVVAHVNGAAVDLAGKWVYKLGLLQAYAQDHDDARVPTAYVSRCGARLGKWLADQRHLERTGRLSARRRDQLVALDDAILLSEADLAWRAKRAALAAYVRREGHARVPKAHVEDGLALGAWVLDLRTRRADRGLPAARVADLDALGFEWTATRDAAWAANYAALADFARDRGHADAPASLSVRGRNVGRWLVSQRRAKRRGDLAPAKEAKLDALGVSWAPTDRADRYARALDAFVAREGHDRVPKRHREDDLGLGEWLFKQRRRARTVAARDRGGA